MAWWWMAVSAAASPWGETFEAERSRALPVLGARTVMAVGDTAVTPSAALCRQVHEVQAPCSVKVLPRRARRDSDQWIASLAPEGFVYVVRPIRRSGNVLVSVYDADQAKVDWYVAHPHQRATPGTEAASLRHEVDDLRARFVALRDAPPVTAEQEREATEHLEAAVAALRAFDPEAARDHLDWLSREAPGSAANRAAERVRRNVSVIGAAAAPRSARVWIVADAAESADTALLVFWEPWCEHSRAILPQVQAVVDAWSEAGVPIYGVSGTDDTTQAATVAQTAADLGWTLPVAFDPAGWSQQYEVDAVPAAVLLHEGSVYWRGHPAHIDQELLDAYRDRVLAPDPD